MESFMAGRGAFGQKPQASQIRRHLNRILQPDKAGRKLQGICYSFLCNAECVVWKAILARKPSKEVNNANFSKQRNAFRTIN